MSWQKTVEPKRLTLLAALVQNRIGQTLDDLADMFVRQMQRTQARAKGAMATHLLQLFEQTDGLVLLLRDTVLACRRTAPAAERLAAIEAMLPDMLRVAVSVRAGLIRPSVILRRLGTYSRTPRKTLFSNIWLQRSQWLTPY